MDIMIVDDSKKMRDMIKKILYDQITNLKHIIECCDGQEAIEAYEIHRPNWVLMDVEMKPMNGLSATAQITDTHPDAKVVIVTQYNEPEFREAANNAGACAYVFKENLIDIPNIIKDNYNPGGNKNENN